MKDYQKETFGLVFEGGGARGSYQIGVWKAIKELNIHVDAVVGTSVGALNGALFAQGDLEAALNIWENIKYSTIINVEDDLIQSIAEANWRELSIQQATTQFFDIVKNRGLDITPLKAMLDKMVDEEKLRTSKIKFGLATYNLSELKPCEVMIDDIEEGKVSGYLLASSYLPAFRTERIFGKLFIDGGFSNVAPISMLVEQGYKNIIVVRINGVGITKKYNSEGVNIIELSSKEDLGRLLELTKARATLNINLGYYDTLKTFMKLVGNKYYIDCNKKEAFFLKKFLMLKLKDLEKVIVELGLKYKENYHSKERFMCEWMIPTIAKRLKITKEASYEIIYMTLIESLMEALEFDRFAIYSLDQLEDMVANKIKSLDTEDLSMLFLNMPLAEIGMRLLEV